MNIDSARFEQHIMEIMPEVRTLPLALQSRALKTVTAYFLRGVDETQALNICQDLLLNLEKDIKSNCETLIDDNSRELNSFYENVLDQLEISESDRASNDALIILENKLNETIQRLKKLSSLKTGEVASLLQIVDILESSKQQSNQAIDFVIQTSFDRLLESMDPKSAEKMLEQSSYQSEQEKKAAMFEALEEKFEQLVAYNSEGLMVRDFRVAYKKKLRKIIGDA